MNSNEKKTIRLEAIDPVEIYGAANKVLEALCSYFPNLKVVARGNEIILEGKGTEIEEFGVKLNMLIERRRHKMNITPYDVEMQSQKSLLFLCKREILSSRECLRSFIYLEVT